MTDIKFFKNNGNFIGFECFGHAGYSKSGKDIVCASISSLTQAVVMGLQDVCYIGIRMTIDDGYLKVIIPQDIEDRKLRDAQVLLETLYIAIRDLQSGYSKYISMEVIENVY